MSTNGNGSVLNLLIGGVLAIVTVGGGLWGIAIRPVQNTADRGIDETKALKEELEEFKRTFAVSKQQQSINIERIRELGDNAAREVYRIDKVLADRAVLIDKRQVGNAAHQEKLKEIETQFMFMSQTAWRMSHQNRVLISIMWDKVGTGGPLPPEAPYLYAPEWGKMGESFGH